MTRCFCIQLIDKRVVGVIYLDELITRKKTKEVKKK